MPSKHFLVSALLSVSAANAQEGVAQFTGARYASGGGIPREGDGSQRVSSPTSRGGSGWTAPTRKVSNWNGGEDLEQGNHRADGVPGQLKGNFGYTRVRNNPFDQSDVTHVANAKRALQKIVTAHFKGNGKENMVPSRVFKDSEGNRHTAFDQEINGLPVAGAGMVMHTHPDGEIYAVNGHFVPEEGLPHPLGAPSWTETLGKANAADHPSLNGRLTEGPSLTYVLGAAGTGSLSYQATYEYELEDGTPQRDIVFVDTVTGKIAAVHPQIYEEHMSEPSSDRLSESSHARKLLALSMNTKNCQESTRNCITVTTSTNSISTGDLALDSAHNYARNTYNYYQTRHNRDSINNAGMTLVSRVHYSRNYDNAFWDGTQMTYGDGSGYFLPLSQDADVVGHELTHGVTEHASNLVYSYESGALNEALSDIFGAMVDRFSGETNRGIWDIGEDISGPSFPKTADCVSLRNMADPAACGDYDYYPNRYTGSSDNGGVHWNSGIANLAFKLLVTGGQHPRGHTTVDVPAIVPDGSQTAWTGGATITNAFEAAADIFYKANVGCLGRNSNFADAQFCTVLLAPTPQKDAVTKAWSAVGVPPPPPPPPTVLTNDVAMTGQSLSIGAVKNYELQINSGSSNTCQITGSNGDADLYVRYGSLPVVSTTTNSNCCSSYTSNSNEICTCSSASAAILYVSVHAYSSFTGLTIKCTSTGGVSGPPTTQNPTQNPTKTPTKAPTMPTEAPTKTPTKTPTNYPTPGTCSAKGVTCNFNTDCCSSSCKNGKNGKVCA